ncbi:MAG: hypothetical protein Q7S40_11325 [Opitutaceae bacterium]|nr:hypothetical protein [Opitutaceae bacterium]
MTRSALVCIITPGNVSSAPRVIKEADALVAAGHRVHVVAGRNFAPAIPFDEQVIARSRWEYTAVAVSSGARLITRMTRLAARARMARMQSPPPEVAARAVHAPFGPLASAAARLGADYFVGHGLGGMSAAASAADTCRKSFGIDLEDFHDAETEAATRDPIERKARHALQRALLPRARHLTAAAPLIAQEYEKRYDVRPTVVLNVFPRHEAPATPPTRPAFSAANPARLYWFSQTIGPGRGLEAVVAIIARMRTPVELQLRGFADSSYVATMQSRARAMGLARPVAELPPAPASEMVRLAAAADLGLSVEESMPLNRDLCLTNKVFAYLLAGIPQLLSRTSAQVAVAPELGSAALLGALDDPTATAAMLDAFLGDATRVTQARLHAWKVAQERYCWDAEKEIFLRTIGSALPRPT